MERHSFIDLSERIGYIIGKLRNEGEEVDVPKITDVEPVWKVL
jgi:hypothetical protein